MLSFAFLKLLAFALNDIFQVAAGATEVSVFGAASESFSKKNINCSICAVEKEGERQFMSQASF